MLSDARRTDTAEFYRELDSTGLAWSAVEEEVREEGLPVRVRLVRIRVPGP